ncbi:prepilin-type N-terminal cleavage/methylation domain-containing protein [Desulfovibrio sp. TomC]|uniref:prepilin-type N-terminal cleavage/methylation domain-containing protein n=1 Tax=Desulfovibrio sp. TomC TaxID=1562888 RepID=UPI0005730BD6|nr:prepilin-type N-terminal cleavage/methylation domain-containing protein [Desulfovibrio sp. TomC]KHK00186.1 Type IV pilin PilA [Desulfovibrio sp. TomC]
MQDQKKRNQKGFTLIEIIAVLVILGILAAVAIPKYQDLKQQSADQAIKGALAAGASQAAMSYAKATMTAPATALATAKTDLTTNYGTLGDFTYTYAVDGSTGITVTLAGGVASTSGKDIWDLKSSSAVLTKTVTFENAAVTP